MCTPWKNRYAHNEANLSTHYSRVAHWVRIFVLSDSGVSLCRRYRVLQLFSVTNATMPALRRTYSLAAIGAIKPTSSRRSATFQAEPVEVGLRSCSSSRPFSPPQTALPCICSLTFFSTMTTLDVFVPAKYDLRHFTMDQLLPSTDNTAHLKFTYDKTIQDIGRGRTEVYRGTLFGPGEEKRRVVCKLIEGDTCPLKYEARIYTTKLADLQGKDVPNLIGFFRAPAKDPQLSSACMLFKEFGHSLTDWLGSYPMPIRYGPPPSGLY